MSRKREQAGQLALPRETLEMVDGRRYFSDDNWQTIYQSRGMPNGSSHRRIIRKDEADKIRFLVMVQK